MTFCRPLDFPILKSVWNMSIEGDFESTSSILAKGKKRKGIIFINDLLRVNGATKRVPIDSGARRRGSWGVSTNLWFLVAWFVPFCYTLFLFSTFSKNLNFLQGSQCIEIQDKFILLVRHKICFYTNNWEGRNTLLFLSPLRQGPKRMTLPFLFLIVADFLQERPLWHRKKEIRGPVKKISEQEKNERAGALWRVVRPQDSFPNFRRK